MKYKLDHHHQSKSEENISRSRTEKRERKRELDLFKRQISNLGGVYIRLSKLLTDTNVYNIRTSWFFMKNNRYENSIKLSDCFDNWLNNTDDAPKVKRFIKLEMLLEE